MAELSDQEYEILLIFRSALRWFERWSAEQARAYGLTAQQHQLLLAVRAHPGGDSPTIGTLARYLLIRHHSAVELTDRVAALGLVRRYVDPVDHRRVLVQLTESGQEVIARLSEAHFAELALVAQRLRITPEFLSNLAEEFSDFLRSDEFLGSDND